MQPERGMLTGAVFYISEPEVFVLKDLAGNDWSVRYEKAVIFPGIKIVEGEKINLLGEVAGQRIFQAERIMPIGPGRKFHEKMIQIHFKAECPMANASSSFACPNMMR